MITDIESGRQYGHAILALTGAVAVDFIIIGAAVLTISQTARNACRTRLHDQAIAVSDAHIEWAFARWRAACQAQRNTTLPASNFAGLSTHSSLLLPDSIGFTVTNYPFRHDRVGV